MTETALDFTCRYAHLSEVVVPPGGKALRELEGSASPARIEAAHLEAGEARVGRAERGSAG